MITLEQAAEFLRGADRVLVLCHQYPDGCTLRRPKGENPLARATALAVTAVEEALRRSGLLRGMRKGECCDEQNGLEPGAVPEI